jgi:hypothetical protein
LDQIVPGPRTAQSASGESNSVRSGSVVVI